METEVEPNPEFQENIEDENCTTDFLTDFPTNKEDCEQQNPKS